MASWPKVNMRLSIGKGNKETGNDYALPVCCEQQANVEKLSRRF